jgi:hypothetical protein
MVARLLLCFVALAPAAWSAVLDVPSPLPTPLSALDALNAAPSTPEPSAKEKSKNQASPTPPNPSSGATNATSATASALSGSTASSLTATALAPSALPTPLATPTMLPIGDTTPRFEKNQPVEDFFVVSITSLPFTGLWAILGTTLVTCIYSYFKNPEVVSPTFGQPERVFAPNYGFDNLLTTGEIAFGASVGNGLLSVYWGQGAAPKNPGAIVAPWVTAPNKP